MRTIWKVLIFNGRDSSHDYWPAPKSEQSCEATNPVGGNAENLITYGPVAVETRGSHLAIVVPEQVPDELTDAYGGQTWSFQTVRVMMGASVQFSLNEVIADGYEEDEQGRLTRATWIISPWETLGE